MKRPQTPRENQRERGREREWEGEQCRTEWNRMKCDAVCLSVKWRQKLLVLAFFMNFTFCLYVFLWRLCRKWLAKAKPESQSS